MAAGSTQAADCDGATFTTSCTMTGTATISGAALGMAAPATQTWSTTLDGLDHQLVDVAAADTSFTVQDFTGSGAGWTVTATATQFTGTGSSSHTLAATGTLVFNGSTSSETAGATPGNRCAPSTTCTLPTTTGLTFPVDLTQDGATVYNLYDASAATGMGTIQIGSVSAGNPAAWWVNVPAGATADGYTSVITLSISSAPVAS
ncbi:MAG TPA: WxL domain-containing protein [Streptosporangiaceae bacterium]|nr:WxL domain-containing protein [Streptosporangiaceae bacterium]